jgi:hypothetical protein
MRILALAAALGVLTTLAGCAVYTDGETASFGAPPPVAISSGLSEPDVAWSRARGSNTITGQAILRTRGGDVKTCAGLGASLIPHTAYAEERLAVTYGRGSEGFGGREARVFNPDPAIYHQTTRTTICDAQGNFRFQNLPDGRYFVLVEVSWDAVQGGYYPHLARQGGTMMSRVEVRGGESREMILTAN